jgi:hypothetical protein
MNIRKKPAEWLKRYGPAELCAIAGAVSGGLLLHALTHNPLLTALGGTWGENLGYYSYIILSDLRRRQDKSMQGLGRLARNMLVEFGPGEYIDSFFVRPAAMYIFPKLLGNIALGLLVGKLAADVLFYIPTIIGYELRRKYFKD